MLKPQKNCLGWSKKNSDSWSVILQMTLSQMIRREEGYAKEEGLWRNKRQKKVDLSPDVAEAHPVLGAVPLLLLHHHQPFSFTSDEKLKSNSGEKVMLELFTPKVLIMLLKCWESEKEWESERRIRRWSENRERHLSENLCNR